jgi:hypothetical protein
MFTLAGPPNSSASRLTVTTLSAARSFTRSETVYGTPHTGTT